MILKKDGLKQIFDFLLYHALKFGICEQLLWILVLVFKSLHFLIFNLIFLIKIIVLILFLFISK